MPPILAGILAIYGLVVAVVISSSLEEKSALHTNFMQLAAGIAVGLSCLSSGLCIGIVGDAGVRAAGQQPRMFVGMMMMLIFAEVLGEYSFAGIRGCGLTVCRHLWVDCGIVALDEVSEWSDFLRKLLRMRGRITYHEGK